MSAASSTAPSPRTRFFMVANEIVDHYGLNPHEFSLYSAIVRHINYKTGLARPSIKRLVLVTRMARPTVVKYLKSLELKGLIRIIRGFKKGTRERAVNQYKILAPSPYCDDEPPALPGPEPDEPAFDIPTDPLEGGSSRLEPPPAVPEPGSSTGSSSGELPVVNEVNQGSSRHEPPVVNALNRNETNTNETLLERHTPHTGGPARSAGSRSPDGGAASPATGVPSSSQKSEKTEKWDHFCHTLADVCQIDFEANEGRIRKTASALYRYGNGYHTLDLRAFELWWYKNDWRGRKGETPRLQDVVELIRAATNAELHAGEVRRIAQTRMIEGDYSDIIQY